ncbi:MAG: hypothetical protein U0992_03765 [Planctomycetaceae bacterium]
MLVGDELYFVSDDGIVTRGRRSGETHWVERLGGNYSASPVFANGHVLLLSEAGTTTWINPRKTFSVVGTNEVSKYTPAFAEGAMYLRTDEYTYKIAHPLTVKTDWRPGHVKLAEATDVEDRSRHVDSVLDAFDPLSAAINAWSPRA